MAFDTRYLKQIVDDIRERPALRAKVVALIEKQRFAFIKPRMPSYMELTVLATNLTDPEEQRLIFALASELQQKKYQIVGIAVEIVGLPRGAKDAGVAVIGSTVHIFF